jgi:hypothetical protein
MIASLLVFCEYLSAKGLLTTIGPRKIVDREIKKHERTEMCSGNR